MSMSMSANILMHATKTSQKGNQTLNANKQTWRSGNLPLKMHSNLTGSRGTEPIFQCLIPETWVKLLHSHQQ